jgi:hypothetical protein
MIVLADPVFTPEFLQHADTSNLTFVQPEPPYLLNGALSKSTMVVYTNFSVPDPAKAVFTTLPHWLPFFVQLVLIRVIALSFRLNVSPEPLAPPRHATLGSTSLS